MVFMGVETNVEIMHLQPHFELIQNTPTYSPTYSPQYSMTYNPQIMLGSPYGAMTGGSITPTVAPQVIITPSASQSSAPELQQSAGGGGMQDMLIAGVAIVAAVLILPSLIKGFTKVKTKGLA